MLLFGKNKHDFWLKISPLRGENGKKYYVFKILVKNTGEEGWRERKEGGKKGGSEGKYEGEEEGRKTRSKRKFVGETIRCKPQTMENI